jgi:hypothetical protein
VEGSLTPNPAEEFSAWREITSLAWRYGIAAVIVIFAVDILPPVLMALLQSEAVSSPFQPTSLSSPNPVYLILGGLVSIIGVVILAVLIIERSTLPARLMLIPADFETQLKGRGGALLTGKFQSDFGIDRNGLADCPHWLSSDHPDLYAEVSSLEIFSNCNSICCIQHWLLYWVQSSHTMYREPFQIQYGS